MKELIPNVKTILSTFPKSGLTWQHIMAFLETETGGKGFNDDGKIIIQFEPSWFKKLAPYAPSGLWSLNGVEVQSKEWLAFNDAFSKNQDGAMKSTSIGLGQIMGFQYSILGYKTVGEMWDDAKKSLDRQIWQVIKFRTSNPKLLSYLVAENWDGVATIYNGAYYKQMAIKWKREPYDITLSKNYLKYKSM
jgi:hypothetical protein